MGHGITPEDREKLMHLKNQNSPDRNSELEYETVEGYEHLDVLQAENRYKVEYGDTSINIPPNRIGQLSLSNFIEDYLDIRDFHEARRLNYKGKSRKAEEFIPVLEAEEDLNQDLSKLADELDPTD